MEPGPAGKDPGSTEGEAETRGAQQAASTQHSLGFVCRVRRGGGVHTARCDASAWRPRAMKHWALLICTCFPGFFVNVHGVCLWVKMQAMSSLLCPLGPLQPHKEPLSSALSPQNLTSHPASRQKPSRRAGSP